MLTTKIPYLHCRNGIYYYRNQSVWKSLRTRCKKEAFRKVSHILFGSSSAVNDTALTEPPAKPKQITSTTNLIKAYLAENGNRWCAREYTRIESSLAFLPKCVITRQIAIDLKASILVIKTATTFNRYLKYFNALYRWILANNALITENPFEGLKVIEKKKNISEGRRAYTPEQLRVLLKFADSYGKGDRRYWLIMIGRFTGARMNEICQLKPQDITKDVIHIRGDVLKTSNAKRSIPTHPKLIELGLLEWVSQCVGNRLFHQWTVVKGSYSHAASRWFSRNNPSKSNVTGEKADVDFHSLRHTVATELKYAGVASQYTAQILGHSNGNITYDRYGKTVTFERLKESIEIIGITTA
ncbi:site-specific integrase [Colwellia sp. BRX10-3]|uniref:site-specific integrase n=1 Tax=Colwellia sp. BRX10-3 TaxID=2759844 RepID=UPI0015F41B43|nr:site-specific integrase [Colwellia sp. BRX10-3]MBA6389220.1 site-specific integrase [Colwellia sp. BRX10-3]